VIEDVRAQLNEKYYNYLASAFRDSVTADLLKDESLGAFEDKEKVKEEVLKEKKKNNKKNKK